MSSSHSKTHEPNEMSNGFVRLSIVITLALLASLLWNSCGKSMHAEGHGGGHGEGHGTAKAEGHEAKHETAAVHIAPAGKVDTATGDFIYETGKIITLDLPNNAGKLEVGEFSTENKLYQFLTDHSQTIDSVKGNWFELTNVRFKKGGIAIDSSSLVQIKNIATLCKAFPTAQFKVGGYTDNTGDSSNNILLSQRRADVVLSEFKKAGISAAAFTGTKGYGAEHPIGDNATAEGRAINRRVAVNVKAK
jgi:outer membrane protein OmpA-like peptidoglycan-associated protein